MTTQMANDRADETRPTPSRYAVPSRFTVQLRPCCGALPGDVCDCAQFAADATRLFDNPLILPAAGAAQASERSSAYPTALVLVNVGGRLRPAKDIP